MKKALNIIKNIFVWLITIFAIFMMIFTLVSVNTFNRAERNLFGYKMFIVLSDSMSKTDFDAGDIVLVKETDPASLKEGDIIAYISQNSHNFGEIVTHKIRKLTTDANGSPGFITYGTTTDTDDETIVTYPYVVGKYTGHIPGVGTFFQFLKTTPGYIICILLPFLLLILFQGLNTIRLFRRYKQEQLEEIQEERERLEAERIKSEKLMQELLELKQQLLEKQNTGEASSASDKS
jgi:signal peptidase